MFDAGAYLRTLEPPVFIDTKGQRHVGLIIGTDTWFRLQSGLRVKHTDGTPDPRGVDRAMRKIVDAIFPKPFWKFWEKSVTWHIWQLPANGRMRAIMDFMQSQAKARGMEPDLMPGQSPTSTAPATSGAVDSPTPGSSGSSTSAIQASTPTGAAAGA